MISVVNFFHIFEIIIFCFVGAICDLVHAVYAFSAQVRVYVAIMHECQRVHYRTNMHTNHAITDLYHYIQPTSPCLEINGV